MVGKHAKGKHRKDRSVVHPPAIPTGSEDREGRVRHRALPAQRKPGETGGSHRAKGPWSTDGSPGKKVRKKDFTKPEEKKP